ncbi:Acyl carrier protein [Shimia haliotis]|uniref:Acyl carrier protein n=1 Tax=Shimia haliotis TaxID=1280847 RepID=A0A1I4C2A7_9RHOB|nr:Acyl carrier protein [Shimia haliotis]
MSHSETALSLVLDTFASVFPNTKILPDSDFFDLGGDSLDLVTLCDRLERLSGCELHPSSLLYHPTVSELAAELTTRMSE